MNKTMPKTPNARVIRKVGLTHDTYTNYKDEKIVVKLHDGETSLNWKPQLLPLFSFPERLQATEAGIDKTTPIGAANVVAIVREGYEGEPLGIATTDYRPVNHEETVLDIKAATEGRCTEEGAIIDGHGYHVVHAFKLETEESDTLKDRADAYDVAKDIEAAFSEGEHPKPVAEEVNGLELISRLMIVHDHTGMGALRASVVSFLGKDVVIGSRNFTRRIHVGAGAKDVGVGSRSRWAGVLEAMLDTAALQQAAIAATLRAAGKVKMTEDVASVFEKAGVSVERVKLTKEEKENGVTAAIVPATALDVVIEHHKQRKGRMTWGVWSRRLEGDALGCLEKITGIELPKQLFRRG